ncbi:MAG: hypothetical protein QM527_07970 [Alphaproteobacteria bacterium]|nr:hypothetical protein [Alphaproteobacteria bacterium]
MNLLTELLLAILISTLLAVNTVVQTNQQTNDNIAIAVGAYLNTVVGSVARFYVSNGGIQATTFSQLTSASGLGLSPNIPAGNGAPIFGVAASLPSSAVVAFVCTAKPLTVRSINSDGSGRDALVNTALLNMNGSGARTYSSDTQRMYGPFGWIDLKSITSYPSGVAFNPGNGILCAWKNISNENNTLKSIDTNISGCAAANRYQIVFSTSKKMLVYCDGYDWLGMSDTSPH